MSADDKNENSQQERSGRPQSLGRTIPSVRMCPFSPVADMVIKLLDALVPWVFVMVICEGKYIGCYYSLHRTPAVM